MRRLLVSSRAGRNPSPPVTKTRSALRFLSAIVPRGDGLGIPFEPSRQPLYEPSPPTAFVSRYYYLLKAVGAFSARSRGAVNSETIFASAEEQATQAAWWRAMKLPRTWFTEHSLIALHVWLLHNRAKVDYNVSPVDFNGRLMQEELFARFWEDTTLRVRNAGIAEISVNKQLENVQKVTFADFFSYDAALRTVDEDDGMELAAALWRTIFREDEGADTEAVLRLADYVRREVVNVVSLPREDLYRGWISWGPVVGEDEEARVERQRAMFEGEWRDALDPKGRVYFYHTASGERRWDPPEAGLYARRRFALERYIEANPQYAERVTPLADYEAVPRLSIESVGERFKREAPPAPPKPSFFSRIRW